MQIVRSAVEAKDVASKMLGHTLITKQTGAEGKPVNKVYLMERLYLRREVSSFILCVIILRLTYLGILFHFDGPRACR